MPKPKKPRIEELPIDKLETVNEVQPIITSITINPTGTIFGLADNKVYRYDEYTKKWGQA